ncbi:hypothetical protein CVUC_05310 [Caulobacter vibrioides]|uniref:hypothetical protein n=1 Tax=Caulobacter vibrioides TaxID=155892 RepID=UPI000BB4FE43|nr:hypothetical protein CA608_12010 [Caulobacter vibrioides]PLR13970.1 hypothetical protein CVUC_05310 [Caulobacter vibrioides]
MAMMTKSEFAAFMKVGPSAVSNWAKRGLIVMGPDPDCPGREKVDAEKSAILINATVDRSRGRPKNSERTAAEAPADEKNPNKSPTLEGASPTKLSQVEQARLDEMRERTTRRRIENGQLLGQLVPVAEYERRAGDMGRMIRERTHGLIRQHAERLAAETDPRAVAALLAGEFDKLFEKIASELEAEAVAELSADITLAAVEAEIEEDEPPAT